MHIPKTGGTSIENWGVSHGLFQVGSFLTAALPCSPKTKQNEATACGHQHCNPFYERAPPIPLFHLPPIPIPGGPAYVPPQADAMVNTATSTLKWALAASFLPIIILRMPNTTNTHPTHPKNHPQKSPRHVSSRPSPFLGLPRRARPSCG